MLRDKFFKKRNGQLPIKKAAGPASVALKKLRTFLDASEPELVFFLVNTWNAQGKAITYKELREALLAGDISPELMDQWYQDYSKFVTEHLQPAWINAMEEATADMAKKYPEWNFDPYADGVRSWTEKKAAEFVTNSTTAQIQGLRAVVMRAAVLEDLNVDQLSRAIRPMVGLTQQQSIANLNYYHNLIKNGTSEKKAIDLAARYAARQHRYRAYNIARTELAFAYNQGSYEGTKQAQEAGYMGETIKVWATADDERVCEICGGLEGKEVAMDDDFNFATKLATPANPTIRRVPPAHPSCRCAVIFKEIAPPIYKPTETPNTKPADAASEKDDGPAAIVPDDYQLPVGLTYDGPAYLGGTGKSYMYHDETGQKWLFKPGQNKDGSPALYRIYVQEAGYKVQHIVDPDTAVPISRFTDIKGTTGAMQKIIDGESLKDELWKLYNGEDIQAALKSQLQREHVTDWLLANFDGHSKQFISNSAGKLVGIDKDQAFRYLKESAAKKMSYSYHPNAIYHENEPIYNALYRLFAKGDIDLDLNDVLPYIKRVESISNKEYREIFRAYAESLNGKGKAAEALLDDIVDRKSSLRETFRSFFEELIEERTGKKIVFQFADEGAAISQNTALAAQTMTKEAALKMTSAELKKIAKDKGIPNFGNMTKDQLATCISDPTQISAMNEQVKAKLAEQAARRAARGTKPAVPATTPKTGKYAIENGVYKASEIFDDFSAIPQDSKLGIAIASDSSKVEGLNLAARRVTVSGKDYIEISGKLTQYQVNLLKSFDDLDKGYMRFSRGPLTNGKVVLNYDDTLVSTRGFSIKSNDIFMEIATDSDQRALMGTFRIRIPDTGDAVADAAKAKSFLESYGFDYITDTPTAADEEVMKKARLLFQNNPKAAYDFGKYGDKAGKIDDALQASGMKITKPELLVKKEVYPGYFTYVNEGASEAYKAAGLEYVWSGVGTSESVVAMVKNGGMMSSMTRINTGFMGNGSSIMSDINSGGADNVFTRVATKGAYKNGERYGSSFASGRYQILIDPKVTERTDWYAYHYDEYGTTRESTMTARPSALEFFKAENKNYRSGNEMMFRHGIDVTDWIGIDCKDSFAKKDLIEALKAEGITEINGTPLERFIRINGGVGKAVAK